MKAPEVSLLGKQQSKFPCTCPCASVLQTVLRQHGILVPLWPNEAGRPLPPGERGLMGHSHESGNPVVCFLDSCLRRN